jgi:hypothetical protein
MRAERGESKMGDIKKIGYQTVSEALKNGDCLHCVSYDSGPITPPFSSHCHATQDRGKGYCAKVKETRHTSPSAKPV